MHQDSRVRRIRPQKENYTIINKANDVDTSAIKQPEETVKSKIAYNEGLAFIDAGKTAYPWLSLLIFTF